MTGEWPSAEIDHIDKNKLNNAWNNLRAASRAQNLTNVAARSATGFKGVYWDKRRKKWKSHITHNRKTINLGRFNSPEAAHAAYMAKATELFQEFASA
jgi:hypothetical protein